MLPDGWKNLLLDEIAQRKSGHTPDKNRSSYWNGGVKWVSLADSWRLDKGLINDTDKEISAEGIKHSSAVLLPAGTVVLSRDAGVGKSAVLAAPMAVSQHFIAWNCSESEELHNWYLYYWLQASKPEFERVANGSAIKTIGLPFFKKLKLDVPPIVEQRHIAQVLATWDEAIATTEATLSNLRRQKDALLRQLFKRRRGADPAYASWGYVDFDQVFERLARKNASGNSNVLTISGEHGLISQRDYFKKNVASANLAGYTLLLQGEFAYNKSYSAGYPMGAIKPLTRYEAGVVSSLYVCFRFRDGIQVDRDFFRHYFEAGLLNDELTGIAQEGARNHGLLNVGVGDFFKLRLHIPAVEEQRRIASILNAAESEERLASEQIRHLQKEKHALMQQLLTGKRRVHKPEPAEAISA